MENPNPKYPSSPFTRKPATLKELSILKSRIKYLNLKVNIALKILLSTDTHCLWECYQEAHDSDDQSSDHLLEIFNMYMRFQIVNEKNSQDSFIGHWVLKTTPPSVFELMYDAWKNTPYQMICPYYFVPINNPQKEYMYHILDNFAKETWGPENDNTLEHLD
jgi:hypothetical protein